jgi:hypothetical protein
MISDRPEREGFANLVRDLIEARELTADLVLFATSGPLARSGPQFLHGNADLRLISTIKPSG